MHYYSGDMKPSNVLVKYPGTIIRNNMIKVRIVEVLHEMECAIGSQ